MDVICDRKVAPTRDGIKRAMHEMCQTESREVALAGPGPRRRVVFKSAAALDGAGIRETAIVGSIRFPFQDAVTTEGHVSDYGHCLRQDFRNSDLSSPSFSTVHGSCRLSQRRGSLANALHVSCDKSRRHGFPHGSMRGAPVDLQKIKICGRMVVRAARAEAR